MCIERYSINKEIPKNGFVSNIESGIVTIDENIRWNLQWKYWGCLDYKGPSHQESTNRKEW